MIKIVLAETRPVRPANGIPRMGRLVQRMIKEGLIVVLSPETVYGRLNLNVYENARRQQAVGILGHNNDMTTETTYLKLAWLLSNYDRADVKKLILTNMRGELRETTEHTED